LTVSLILEVQQVLTQIAFCDPMRGLSEMAGELPHGREVCLLGPLSNAGQLQVLELRYRSVVLMKGSIPSGVRKNRLVAHFGGAFVRIHRSDGG
jgi:hypothetical protein